MVEIRLDGFEIHQYLLLNNYIKNIHNGVCKSGNGAHYKIQWHIMNMYCYKKISRNSGTMFSQKWLFSEFRNNLANMEVKMARYVWRTFADKTLSGEDQREVIKD